MVILLFMLYFKSALIKIGIIEMFTNVKKKMFYIFKIKQFYFSFQI
jgi:hypothetical protein